MALYRSYPHTWNGDPTFVSPRQQVTYELSKRWADAGKPAFAEPLLGTLDPDVAPALVPRDASSRDDEIIPKDFPVTVALYAATHVVASRLVPAVSPFFACIALLLFALLVDRVTRSRRAAWIATALLAATTSFWMSSAATVSGDSVGLCGMFAACYALVRLSEGARWRWVAAAAIGFGLMVASRYTLIGPAAVILATFAWHHRDRFWRWFGVGAGLVAALLPVLVYHTWMYGGPTKTGYGLADKVFKERVRFEGRGLTTINFGRVADHLRYYLARPEIAALWLLAITAIVVVFVRRERGSLRTFALATPLVSLPLVVYHGGQGLWGSVGFTTNSSYLRYLLPVFALWCLLAGWLLDRVAGRPSPVWRDRVLALTAAIAALAMWTTYDGPSGVRQLEDGVPYQGFLTQVVIDRTPPDALVISRTGSKILWPERNVLTATLLYDGDAITDEKILLWDVVPSAERLAQVSGDLVDDGHDVFIYDDGASPGWLSNRDITEIRAALAVRGMRLRVTVTDAVPPLYHVVAAAP